MTGLTRAGLIVLAILAILSCGGTVAAGGETVSDGPDWNTTPDNVTRDNLQKSIVVTLHESGNATVDIRLNYLKYVGESGRHAPATQDEYYFDSPNSQRFASLSQNTTAVVTQLTTITANQTGRDVQATHKGTTYDYERRQGVTIHFTYKLTNLAETRADGSLAVTQPFAQPYNTLYGNRDSTITFVYPDGMTVGSVTPDPAKHHADSNAITYNTEHPMDGLKLVVSPSRTATTPTETSTNTPEVTAVPGQSTSPVLVGFGIIGAFVVVALVHRRLA